MLQSRALYTPPRATNVYGAWAYAREPNTDEHALEAVLKDCASVRHHPCYQRLVGTPAGRLMLMVWTALFVLWLLWPGEGCAGQLLRPTFIGADGFTVSSVPSSSPDAGAWGWAAPRPATLLGLALLRYSLCFV